jgi:hypothetical protein
VAPRTKTIKVGTVIPVQVTREDIDASYPCDKDSCMLTRAGIRTLKERFGDDNYRVKSTNHGMTFDIGGHRVLCVFDHQTGHRIYQYDEVYKKTRSVAKARAAAKPSKAKLMVESCQRIPVYPPMSEETKKALRERPRRKPLVGKTGIKVNNRRKLSE